METSDAGDADEIFAGLMADLDLQEPTDVVNVALLDEVELSRRYNAVKQALLEKKEMLHPKTQEGRDLHSERASYLLEMRRRRML
jgi:hypothetical protein